MASLSVNLEEGNKNSPDHENAHSFGQHGPGEFRDATHVAKQSSNCASDKKRCTEKIFIKREGGRKTETGIFTPVINSSGN